MGGVGVIETLGGLDALFDLADEFLEFPLVHFTWAPISVSDDRFRPPSVIRLRAPPHTLVRGVGEAQVASKTSSAECCVTACRLQGRADVPALAASRRQRRRLALEREDTEAAFVDAAAGFFAEEPLDRFDSDCELADCERPLGAERALREPFEVLRLGVLGHMIRRYSLPLTLSAGRARLRWTPDPCIHSVDEEPTPDGRLSR
jgi:hypothetical protein